MELLWMAAAVRCVCSKESHRSCLVDSDTSSVVVCLGMRSNKPPVVYYLLGRLVYLL